MGVFLDRGVKLYDDDGIEPYDDDGVKVVVHDEDGDENIKIMIILLSILERRNLSITPMLILSKNFLPKVLDASRGDLLSRLERPDRLQGSGCRVQFGLKHFLTRYLGIFF